VAFLTIDAQVGFEGGGGEAARGGSTIFFVCDILELLNKLVFLHNRTRDERDERREERERATTSSGPQEVVVSGSF
jgi:hypothetical protein